MSGFDNRLSALDEQLEGYEPFKRWLIYLAIALGIILISWMFFASESLNELENIQKETTALKGKIRENSPEIYRNKIARLNQSVQEKEETIADLKSKKEALVVQMSHSQGLVFDNRHYADTLDHLLARSVELGVSIESIHSQDSNELFYGRVKKFKILTIKGNGQFRSIASFLSFIEGQKTLVEIERVQIRSDEKNPSFEATIFYMGVAL